MNFPALTDRALDENLPNWGVVVLESHHSARFSMDRRTHPFLKLIYVIGGRGVIEIGGSAFPFEPGDIVCVPPMKPNQISDSPDAASSLYVCCIATDLFGFDPKVVLTLPRGTVDGGPHFSARVASQLRRMRHEQSRNNTGVSLSMVSGAMKLVDWVIRQQSSSARAHHELEIEDKNRSDRQIVEEYVERLTTEFYDATTIDDAVNSLGMSRRTFTKWFHEVTGQSWLSYVRRLAIRHAQCQLRETNQSIVSIAFECGFNDLSTFYRQFKTNTGTSPNEYRKSFG